MTLDIEDNGIGFNTNEVLSKEFRPEMGGNGLINIQRRANDLGGTCRIQSEMAGEFRSSWRFCYIYKRTECR